MVVTQAALLSSCDVPHSPSSCPLYQSAGLVKLQRFPISPSACQCLCCPACVSMTACWFTPHPQHPPDQSATRGDLLNKDIYSSLPIISTSAVLLQNYSLSLVSPPQTVLLYTVTLCCLCAGRCVQSFFHEQSMMWKTLCSSYLVYLQQLNGSCAFDVKILQSSVHPSLVTNLYLLIPICFFLISCFMLLTYLLICVMPLSKAPQT